MKIWLSVNILKRINELKHEQETTTQFVIRAVEDFVLRLESEENNGITR